VTPETQAGQRLVVRLIYVDDIGDDKSVWPYIEDISDTEEADIRERIYAIEAEAKALGASAERDRLAGLITALQCPDEGWKSSHNWGRGVNAALDLIYRQKPLLDSTAGDPSDKDKEGAK
jgi:hypothetical protein